MAVCRSSSLAIGTGVILLLNFIWFGPWGWVAFYCGVVASGGFGFPSLASRRVLHWFTP